MCTRHTVSGPIETIACSRSASRTAVNSASVSSVGPVAAVRVHHVPHFGDERLEARAQRRDAVDRERAHGRPVVGDLARDRLVLAWERRPDVLVVPDIVGVHPLATAGEVVLARELPRGLDRLRAAVDEEDAVQVAGRKRGELTRELDRARMGIRPVGVEGQLAHLGVRRLSDLLAEPVADVDREEACERVEIALAVRVGQIAAVAADDHRDLRVAVAAHAGEVQPQVVSRGLLEVYGHAAPFPRRFWTTMFVTATVNASTKIAVARTLTCGGAPTRAAPQTNSGNVVSAPELK